MPPTLYFRAKLYGAAAHFDEDNDDGAPLVLAASARGSAVLPEAGDAADAGGSCLPQSFLPLLKHRKEAGLLMLDAGERHGIGEADPICFAWRLGQARPARCKNAACASNTQGEAC